MPGCKSGRDLGVELHEETITQDSPCCKRTRRSSAYELRNPGESSLLYNWVRRS